MQINGFPVERKKLEELTKAPYNPRKISPEMASALKRSLQEFGNVEPIVWNKQTGHIVGGHQRFDALLSIGETETDVVIVDMPEEREQVLNIALNKISGDWDNGMLSDVLLSMHDELRQLTGFSEDEIAALLPKADLVLSDLAPDHLDQQDFYMSFTLTKEEYEICCKAMDTARVSGGIKKPKNDNHSAEIFFALCNEYLQVASC